MADGTGDDGIFSRIERSLEESVRPDNDKRQIMRLLESVDDLIRGGASSLDVKIASAALREMEDA